MRKSFWGIVWSNFLKIQGVLIGVIGIALAIFLWLFPPRTNIPLWLALLIGILALTAIVTFASTAYEIFITSKQFFSLPRVIGSKKITLTNRVIVLIFVLEPSELFSYDTIVSLYYLEDDFEQLIAIGRVRNIQQDSKIQVEVIEYASGHEEVFKKLERNDYTALKKTRVKPNIPKAYLDGIL